MKRMREILQRPPSVHVIVRKKKFLPLQVFDDLISKLDLDCEA